MTHEDFKKLVHEYLRGLLTDDQRRELEQHAAECPSCEKMMSACQELTCREFVDFLHAYIDMELPAKRATVFDRHLAVCPDCESYVDSYRRTMSLSTEAMKTLGKREIPEDLVRAILDARKPS